MTIIQNIKNRWMHQRMHPQFKVHPYKKWEAKREVDYSSTRRIKDQAAKRVTINFFRKDLNFFTKGRVRINPEQPAFA